MSTTKLHDYIYNIEISEIQAELDVMKQMSNTYTKAANILEYYDGNDLSSFKIFNDDYSSDNIIQEGKIMDDVKKQGEGKSVLNKIVWFIPRLIMSLIKALKGQLKDDKQVEIQNQVTQNEQRRSKLSKEQKILALKLAGIPILVGGTIYAGSKVIKVSQKTLENINKNKGDNKNKGGDNKNKITKEDVDNFDEVIKTGKNQTQSTLNQKNKNNQTSTQASQSKDQTQPTPQKPSQIVQKQGDPESSIVIDDETRKKINDTEKNPLATIKFLVYNEDTDEYLTRFNFNMLDKNITYFNSVVRDMIDVMKKIINNKIPRYEYLTEFEIVLDEKLKNIDWFLIDDDFDIIHYIDNEISNLFPLNNIYSAENKTNIKKQITELNTTIDSFNTTLTTLSEIKTDDDIETGYYRSMLSKIFNNIRKIQEKMSEFINNLNSINSDLVTIKKILLNESEEMTYVSSLKISNDTLKNKSEKLNKDKVVTSFNYWLKECNKLLKNKKSIDPKILKKAIAINTFTVVASSYKYPESESEISKDEYSDCLNFIYLIDEMFNIIKYKEIFDEHKEDIKNLYDKIYNIYIEQIDSLFKDIKDYNNTENINEETYNSFIEKETGLKARDLWHNYKTYLLTNEQFNPDIEKLKEDRGKLEKIKNTLGIK